MAHGTDSRRLPARLLRRVKEHIAAYAGLEPPDWVLSSRLSQRLDAVDRSPEAYAALITSDAGTRELELLLETLRVGETRFFRHTSHVAALTDIVIPAVQERERSGPVRAWSAGCATGEEAYTLAMVLRKLLPPRFAVSVLASDISAEALEVARRGVYREAALAHVPPTWRSYGFSRAPTGDDAHAIARKVADLVGFERRNLADGGFPRGFDVIWCRNVLIYFTREARDETVARLIDSLAPGGFLFLGYAETLRDADSVDAVRAPDAVLYRKPIPGDRAQAAPSSAPAPREPAPVFRRADPDAGPANSAGVTPEEAVIELHGRYDGGGRLSRELAAVMSGPYRAAVIDLDGATYLADETAAVLRRARSAARAAGMKLSFVADRPGPRRFLVRAGLLEEDAR